MGPRVHGQVDAALLAQLEALHQGEVVSIEEVELVRTLLSNGAHKSFGFQEVMLRVLGFEVFRGQLLCARGVAWVCTLDELLEALDATNGLALLLKSLVGRQLEEGCIHPFPLVYHVLELVEQEQALFLVSNILIVNLI